MKIEELWAELEAEPPGSAAWRSRAARPLPGHPLLVALEQATRARALLLPVSRAALPPRREWPECQGLDLVTVSVGSDLHLGVRLKDARTTDVFTVLAEDLAPRIGAVASEKEAVIQLFDRLRCWQLFLAAARGGMSDEAQCGLFGELHVLWTHLVPRLGARTSVEGWKGSFRAAQDFQFPRGAIEVKMTRGKQPHAVRISSERQLDETGVGALFLHVVVVDMREVAPLADAPGKTLAGLIADIRAHLGDDVLLLSSFRDRLLEVGWLDETAPRYENRRCTVRSEHTFRIGAGFPRLVEHDLPAGVGNVSYGLDLQACSAFTTTVDSMLNALSGVNP